MIKRTFKAKICDDFKMRWLEAAAKDEGYTTDSAIKDYDNPDLESLSHRISGKIVDITENEYTVGDADFFEVIDNNFVMHPELFEEVPHH